MSRMVAWVWRGDDGAVGGRLGWQTGGAEGGMAEAKVDAVLAAVKKNEKRLDIRFEAAHVAADGIADCGWTEAGVRWDGIHGGAGLSSSFFLRKKKEKRG